MGPSGERHCRVKEEDQRTRKHTLTKKADLGVCTFEKSMLYIQHIILDITKVTGRRNVFIPSSLLDFEGADVKAKSGHTAHNVFGQSQVSRMICRALSLVSKIAGPEINHKLAQIQRVG
eukprot:1154770-Pelagomonas_calceolata.AAC.1